MSRRRMIGWTLGGAALVGTGAIGYAVGRREDDSVVTAAPSTPPVPTTAADEPTRPAATTAAIEGRPPLPASVSAMWINAFELPSLGQIPSDVAASINMFIFAMAQSAVGGTGQLDFHPYQQDPTETAAEIRAAVDGGTPVLLGVGGSSDGGITVTDDRQVDEFCTSIAGYVDQYGFTGIDIDLEPSGSEWTQAALVQVVRRLKAKYGRDFLVGLTISLYGEHTERWVALATELGDDYDYWAPMLYDFPEAHDERLIPEAMNKIALAVENGIPEAKHVLGFMCNAYYNTSPVAVTAQVWDTAVAQYPALRGAFIWESRIEADHDYEWTRQVGSTLVSRG